MKSHSSYRLNRRAGLAFFVVLAVSAANALAVSIDWTPVGNPNGNDGTGFGAVNHAFNVGTYEVTNRQYAEFLNAKDPTGANLLGLYNTGMGFPDFPQNGGISFVIGNANGTKYSAIAGHENQPVGWVNWYDSIRFANWLNNGQGSGDTESGAYTLLGGTPVPSNALAISRNVGAKVFLPNENEWYKAAYYDPTTTSYFPYPTASFSLPTAVPPPGSGNSANYNHVLDRLTNVGAYATSDSAYGTFDQGGNVAEWNETLVTVDERLRPSYGLRGGSYVDLPGTLAAASRNWTLATVEGSIIGFRVASIPEPTALALAGIAAIVTLAWRCRLECRSTRARGELADGR